MNFFSKIFRYQPQKEYNFILPNSSNNILVEENENIDIYPTLSVNLDYLKVKYNLIINKNMNQSFLNFKIKKESKKIIQKILNNKNKRRPLWRKNYWIMERN